MSKINIAKKSKFLEKVITILDEKKIAFKSLAKTMELNETQLINILNKNSFNSGELKLFKTKLSNALEINESYFNDAIKDLFISFEIITENKKDIDDDDFETNPIRDFINNKSQLQKGIEEKVRVLVRKKGISFVELASRIGYSNAGLHRSFSNSTISVTTLESIAQALDVDVSYFFENIVIEKLVDEIISHNKTTDLKNFMFGFSRDISKGLSLKEAVYKNIDPEGYSKISNRIS